VLENEKVDLIVAGDFGEKIIQALKERNIKKLELTETYIKEAIKRIKCHAQEELEEFFSSQM